MAADYDVLYQDTRPDVASNGRLIRMRDIHFRVKTGPAAGHEDMVTVQDQPGYSAAVPDLIQAKVDEVNAVAGL
jgi:hypothetical protein